MTVELIAANTSNRVVLEDTPALVGQKVQTPVELGGSTGSGYHCLISRVNGQLFVWDLGGQEGTFVNGARVTHSPLNDSDTLGLGGTDFRVHYTHPVRRYVYGVRN